MINGMNLLQNLTPFENNKTVLKADQSVGDIIAGILANHDKYKRDYDKICKHFQGSSDYQTGKNIWKFLKANVKYVVEPDSKQFLKSPAAIIATGSTTGSDCKNYSMFTGGILDALNRLGGKHINWCYRFSSYSLTNKTPQHIFVVINPDTNKEIWVDAVIKGEYNYHKQYYFKIDKKVKQMALIALSGIGRRKKANPKRKKFFQKVKAGIKKAGRFQLKFALAPSRNGFLAVVGLNGFGLAYKLKAALQKNPQKLQDFWEKVGGDFSKFKNTIIKGAKHKKLGSVEDSGEAIGSALAAAIAAATPIVMKVAAILKKLGIKSDDIKKLANKLIKKAGNKALQNINKESKGEETGTGDQVEQEHSGDEAPEEQSGDEAPEEQAAGDDDAQSEEPNESEEGAEGDGVGRIRRTKVRMTVKQQRGIIRKYRIAPQHFLKVLKLAVKLHNNNPLGLPMPAAIQQSIQQLQGAGVSVRSGASKPAMSNRSGASRARFSDRIGDFS